MTRRKILLKALASMPPDVSRLIQGVQEADARRRPAPDRWSLADILSHLLDIESRYRAQLARVVQEDKPTLPPLHPDEAAHDLDTAPDALADRFQAARQETLTFLKGLSPGEWQRKAILETRGETTLRFLVQFLIDHDTAHLGQLVEARQELRAPSSAGQITAPSQDPKQSLKSEEKNERKRTRKRSRRRIRRD